MPVPARTLSGGEFAVPVDPGEAPGAVGAPDVDVCAGVEVDLTEGADLDRCRSVERDHQGVNPAVSHGSA